MARLDARCKARIPVVIIVKGHDGNLKSVTTNLGLGGAFINSSMSLPENTPVRLRAPLPKGELDVEGKVLRQEQDGVAVKFLGVGEQEKSALWEYIRENMEKTSCPFCGAALQDEEAECPACGMRTPLEEQVYTDEQKKKEDSAWCDMLDMETERFLSTMEDLEKSLLNETVKQEFVLKKTHDAIYGMVDTIVKFEGAVQDRELVSRNRKEFINRTHCMFSKSYFMNHARIWPKGYQGDYKILEGIYRNIPLSQGIGYFMDYHFLQATLAKACRGRLAKSKEILGAEFMKRETPRFLDLGCGSSRDLFEMAEEIKKSGASLTCVDIDEDALLFSLNRLSFAGLDDQVKFRKYNVGRMINRERNLREFGPQDIIYSAGVFNYLPDDIIPKLIGSLYELLSPGGRLIIAFEDASLYVPQEYQWIINWDGLLQRTQTDCHSFFKAAGFLNEKLKTDRDETGVIMVCTLDK